MMTDSRYKMATRGMDLLEESHLPYVKKLRLQVLLLEVRILLLKAEPLRARDNDAFEQTTFAGILLQMEQLCQEYCTESFYRKVAEGLNEVVKELSSADLLPQRT